MGGRGGRWKRKEGRRTDWKDGSASVICLSSKTGFLTRTKKRMDGQRMNG